MKVQAIDRLGFAKNVRDKAVEDGQYMGEALLYAEAKMGELLKVQTSRGGSLNYKSGATKSLPDGITSKHSHYAQQLAEHQDLIAEVIEEAKENEDIPTRTQVLSVK